MTCLDVLQLAANRAGFQEVDIVDNDPGRIKVIARRPGVELTSKGKNLQEVVEKFLNSVGEDISNYGK